MKAVPTSGDVALLVFLRVENIAGITKTPCRSAGCDDSQRKGVKGHLGTSLSGPLGSASTRHSAAAVAALSVSTSIRFLLQQSAALRLSHYPRLDSPSRFILAISAVWSIFMNCITTLLNGGQLPCRGVREPIDCPGRPLIC